MKREPEPGSYAKPFDLPFFSSLCESLDPLTQLPSQPPPGSSAALSRIYSSAPLAADAKASLDDLAETISGDVSYAIGSSPEVRVEGSQKIVCSLQTDALDNVIGVLAFMNIYVEGMKVKNLWKSQDCWGERRGPTLVFEFVRSVEF
mmetsp:Transcript_23153/g.58703  ORF Transcript_23153/g.58703 Transcript_23153/m.58703 type:complete len:147 (+) Transcript_23153:95-535(+)